MRENLDDSLELIFGHEGGYVNVKTDKGGPTKYGITQKTLSGKLGRKATIEDVKKLTLDDATEIYIPSYWIPAGGDLLPKGLDYAVFDAGVMSGANRAVRWLQEVLAKAGLYDGKIDGWVGTGTVGAVKKYPGGTVQLIRDYCERRMDFLRGIKGKQGFPSNGRGWTIRVTGKDPKGQWADVPGVVGNAVAMASKNPIVKPKANAYSTHVDDEMSAKAEPGAIDAYLKPEVALPAAGAAGSAVLPFIGEIDILKLAIAVAIFAAVAVGVYFAYRRIRRTA
jgi:lysozyme family protein